MIIKQLVSSLIFISGLGMASPVTAQKVGSEVVGPAGEMVGTVKALDEQYLIVLTDRHEVRLPKTSFTPHEGKLLFGMTRDQLNAETDKAIAAAASQLVPGALVKGSTGASIGTIDAIDASFVTLKLVGGQLVRLPRSAVGAGVDGPVIGMTAAQLDAAVKSSAGS